MKPYNDLSDKQEERLERVTNIAHGCMSTIVFIMFASMMGGLFFITRSEYKNNKKYQTDKKLIMSDTTKQYKDTTNNMILQIKESENQR